MWIDSDTTIRETLALTVNLDLGLTGTCGDPTHVHQYLSSVVFSCSRGVGAEVKEEVSGGFVSPSCPTETEGAMPKALALVIVAVAGKTSDPTLHVAAGKVRPRLPANGSFVAATETGVETGRSPVMRI